MKKIILTFRQFIAALRVLKNLPTMQSDLYKVMNATAKNEIRLSEHSRDIDSISHSIADMEREFSSFEDRIDELESVSTKNYRAIEELDMSMSNKISEYDLEDLLEDHSVVYSYDVMDIVRDQSSYIEEDELGNYTLNESEIRELVQEEMLEFTPESVETAHNLSDEEYHNIVRDVIREIVQRLEM